MRRHHFIEIEDEPWCPRFLRDGITDFLQFMIRASSVYEGVLPILREAIAEHGDTEIVDLCSGSGGPWSEAFVRALQGQHPRLRITLTDLYPKPLVVPATVSVSPRSVDATRVPAELSGFRTMFTAFHHFRPEQARQILKDAAEHGRPIFIAELTERSIPSMLSVLMNVITVPLVTPFIRPLRPSRLFFVYCLPLLTLGIIFDGLVSCLRTYTVAELEEMTAGLGAPGYRWRVGRTRAGALPLWVTYLVGIPAPR